MASKNLETYRTFALSSTPSLRRRGPLVQTAPQLLNQRWLDYTGLSAKQVLGSGWEVAIHPDGLPRILETFREDLIYGELFEVEDRAAGKAKSCHNEYFGVVQP
jgi:hypothetical protein